MDHKASFGRLSKGISGAARQWISTGDPACRRGTSFLSRILSLFFCRGQMDLHRFLDLFFCPFGFEKTGTIIIVAGFCILEWELKMEEITAEQFLESAKAWKPEEDFKTRVDKQLRAAHAPEELVAELSQAFRHCSASTYDYIQYIHELATTKEIDRTNFLPQVAHLVGLVHEVQKGGREYRDAFQKYDAMTRAALTRDEFDTVYYDAIQNIELRVLLKKVIEEVELVLQSFSLVSGDLSGIQCIDLYESSIRFQLL